VVDRPVEPVSGLAQFGTERPNCLLEGSRNTRIRFANGSGCRDASKVISVEMHSMRQARPVSARIATAALAVGSSQEQQHLVVTRQKSLDLADDELVMRRRLKALMPGPLG
jgi:hypothetical protein